MNGLQLLTRPARPQAFGFNEWLGMWSLDNLGSFVIPSLASPTTELPDTRFSTMVSSLYARNGVIYAIEALRLGVFAEARPQWRQLRNGRPGDLFGTPELRILEEPWPGGTTADLMARSQLSADLAGAAFIVRRPTKLEVLRPDWMSIAMGVLGDPDSTAWALDAEILAFAYQPGGPGSSEPIEYLDPADVAHYTGTTPDPLSPSKRGVPWVYPILRDLLADVAATRYKQSFFDNGATPSMVIKMDKSIVPEKWREWVRMFKEKHEGAANAFKTLYLGAGADVTVVGSTFEQIDFRNLGAGSELRLCAAGEVPPVLVGLSGGSGSSGGMGPTTDYPAARRRFADATIRPKWRNFFGSLQTIVPPPPGAQLWYDDSDVAFLREDLKDAANIHQIQVSAITQLIREGFEADDAVTAVTSGDLTRLKGRHTGLISVQLQPPGTRLDGGPAGASTDPEPKVTKAATPQIPASTSGAVAVTRELVLSKREELEAAGLDAGYDTLARELGVSRETIRRRLRTN